MANLVEYVNIFNIPTIISNNLNVIGNTNLDLDVNIQKNINISGNLNIKNNINISDDLYNTNISTNKISTYNYIKTFKITTEPGKYLLNGIIKPILYLIKGNTYIFDLNNDSNLTHPFYITTSELGGTGNSGSHNLKYDSGVINNGTNLNYVIFNVPDNAPNILYYNCGNHQNMGNKIIIIGHSFFNSYNDFIIEKNVSVSGNGIFNDTIYVPNLIISDSVDISNNLTVCGNSIFNEQITTKNLTVSNELHIGNNLIVNGNSIFNNKITTRDLNISNSLEIGHNLTVYGNSIFKEQIITKNLNVSNLLEIDKNLTVKGNSIFNDKITTQDLTVEKNIEIEKNLSVNGNAVFNSGIILGDSTINSAIETSGSIRYSGFDIEGYLNGSWNSLTSGGGGGGGGATNTFQLNNITQNFTYLESIIGLHLEETTISKVCTKNYQVIANTSIYNILEINIIHQNLNINNLSYSLNIYVNESIIQTEIININNTSSYDKSILVFINDLTINANNKLQLELKANDTISEGGTIFISLHGKSTITTTTTNINDNFRVGNNLTVSGNAIFNSGISLGDSTINSVIETPGTIRYSGTDIEGYLNGSWNSLTKNTLLETQITTLTNFVNNLVNLNNLIT